MYAGGLDKSLREFIEKLDPQKVKCVAAFGTSAIAKTPVRLHFTVDYRLTREKLFNFVTFGAYDVFYQ